MISTRVLEELLFEDCPYGDLTTEALSIGDKRSEMRFFARDRMTGALIQEAAKLIELTGARVVQHAASGSSLEPSAEILVARGRASQLLRAWKVAQTLIEVWSGVASAVKEVVDAASSASSEVTVACTRKNVPGTKAFAVLAVRAGGATMHRLGLSETILVFPEHLALQGQEAFSSLVASLSKTAPEKKLIIEVTSVEMGVAAAEAGFHVIQAERFTTSEIHYLRSNMSHVTPRPKIIAAGGVTPENAAAYAHAGAEVLVTSWPYLARPRDVKVVIQAV